MSSSTSFTNKMEKPTTIKVELQDTFLSSEKENNEAIENSIVDDKELAVKNNEAVENPVVDNKELAVINDCEIKQEYDEVKEYINENDFTKCEYTIKNEKLISITNVEKQCSFAEEVGSTEIQDDQHPEKPCKTELPVITKELVVKLTRCIIPKTEVCHKEEVTAESNTDNINTENRTSEVDGADAPSDNCENRKSLLPLGLGCCLEQNKKIKGVRERKKHVKCSVCSFSFNDKNGLRHHISSHTEEMFITQADNIETFIDNNYSEDVRKKVDIENLHCKICKKCFRTKPSFIFHLLIHRNDKKFVCNICNRSFARQVHLKNHSLSHDRGIAEYVVNENNIVKRMYCRYKCDICGVGKRDKHTLAGHMICHTHEMLTANVDNVQLLIQNSLPKDIIKYIDRKNRTCHRCQKTFSSENRFLSHILLHSNIKRYLCSECDKSFTSKVHLSTHLLIHTEIKKFNCDICHKSFKSKNYIRGHINYYCKNKEFICKLCKISFKTEADLSHHEKLSHTCTISFPVKDELKKHLLSQNEDKKYICGICDKRIITKNGIRMHLKIHDKSNTYFCNICEKSFNSKRKISRHLVIHSDIKKYVCTVCGKMFKRSSELKSHSVTHSSNRSILCSICNKTLKHKQSLRNHLLMHEGTKNHKCITCGKLFSQRAHLSSHILTHNRIKNFSCSICGRLFAHKHSLKNHLLLHYNIKKFSCHVCNKLFTQKVHLSTHLMYVHNIKTK